MIEAVIREKLKKIEETERVKIIMAVESGSRAWGFASPDSDYDVRFVYVREPEAYLRLEKTRDVMEWQLDEVFDINGWDLKKALQLLHASNPSIFEWCASPIVYRDSEAFCELRKLRKDYYSPKKNLYHYWHMARSNNQTYLKGDQVRIKKYFYVIRPLLAGRWIAEKKTQPPMLFSELIREELPAELKPIIDDLLEQKKKLPEMGTAPRIRELDWFIESELERIKQVADQTESKENDWEVLNQFFCKQVGIKPQVQ